jgi:RNA polymerase subunit RPABC4/transcription elongation factor Spt4
MLHDDSDQCPYCKENVNFNELRTTTFSEKRKKVKVIVQRCPECRRIVNLDIPISPRIKKDE